MSVKINFTNFNVAKCGALTINYYIDDRACKAVDMCYGFSCYTITTDDQKLPVIVMGDRFTQLPDNAKMFFLAHEAGHINLGHLDKFDQMYGDNETYASLCKSSTPTIEIEADSFAVGVLLQAGLTWEDIMDIYDTIMKDLKFHNCASEQIARRKELIECCKSNIMNSFKKMAQYR